MRTVTTPDTAAITFDATPYMIKSWMILKLPHKASTQLPSRGQVMVKGTINGVALETPLEPDGRGDHWFRVTKELQKAADIALDHAASLSIGATKDWPEPEIPAYWQAALDANPQVVDLWNKITPMARWEWLRWINSTNQPETHKRHIEVSISKLAKGMRRPCCFNRAACCVPEVCKGGMLPEPAAK